VAKTDTSTIEKYQDALRKDPDSKLFAPLAEAYRERDMIKEAEDLARDGVKRHPNYVGGYITLGRILSDMKRFEEAAKCLEKAIQLSPDNLLAYQILAESYLYLNRPKDALKAHKMALFLNPMSTRSRLAVEKLESTSADEFEADVFEMKPIPQIKAPVEMKPDLARSLSLLDALIVRQDMAKARQVLENLRNSYPDHPEVQSRRKMLNMEEPIEQPELLRPALGREKAVLDKKIKKLKTLLAVVENKKLDIRP
jgi:tetratricopeptide (TPR) repeat protein